MPIKAIVFDADGVVIHPWRFADLLDQQYGITRVMTRGFFNGVFEECLLGRQDLKTALPPYLQTWGWDGTVDEFVETWLEEENAPDERVLSVVRNLSNKGYICCLATLQERYRTNYIRERMGFSVLFDHLFFSCEIGYTKMDPEFYKHITQMLGLKPMEFFFWDDSVGNVKTARAFGWQAEVYVNFESLNSMLTSFTHF